MNLKIASFYQMHTCAMRNAHRARCNIVFSYLFKSLLLMNLIEMKSHAWKSLTDCDSFDSTCMDQCSACVVCGQIIYLFAIFNLFTRLDFQSNLYISTTNEKGMRQQRLFDRFNGI